MRPFLLTLGLTPLLAGLVFTAPLKDKEEKAPKPDLGRVAVDLAKQLGEKLVKQAPKVKGDKFRVAVFAFGNNEGKYPLEMGDNGPILRGALVDELRAYLDKNAPGKFNILYPEQVDEQIRESSADPAGISGKNTALARKLLKNYDFQVGIVGRFEIKKPGEVSFLDGPDRRTSFVADTDLKLLARPRPGNDVTINTKAVLDSVVLEASSLVEKGDVNGNGFVPPINPPTSRLSVAIEVKIDDAKSDSNPTAWKTVPLKASSSKDKSGLFYLVVPKDYLGKRYRIVLTNNGKPALDSAELDPDRLFAATVLIDGMNSSMRYDGKQYRHISGHPATLSKWVLTPVGKRIVADKAGLKGRIEGGTFATVKGPGGSRVQLLGFQKGREAAGTFVFARAVDSVAAPELLASRKIGTISVYWYDEWLPLPPPPKVKDDDPKFSIVGSKSGDGEAGTAMGKEVRSATFPVKVLNWRSRPTSITRILYRYEGSPALPNDLVLVK